MISLCIKRKSTGQQPHQLLKNGYNQNTKPEIRKARQLSYDEYIDRTLSVGG